MTRTNYNYPKRIAEQTDRIRRIAATLPPSQRHTLINAAEAIELHSRKAASNTPPTNMELHDEIGDRYNTARRIVAALLDGETLSYLDAARFHTAEFHTRIVDAREIVARHYPGYTFRSEWRRGKNCNYKIYWLEYAL